MWGRGKEQMFHFDPVECEVSVRNPRGLSRRQSHRVVALGVEEGTELDDSSSDSG